MEQIIGCGHAKDDAVQHVNLRKWEGDLHEKNTSQTFDNVNANGRELL
jgi:hypothetical protein